LGAVGLAVIQAAKKAGARYIVGVDMNVDKFAVGKEFGMDHGVDAKEDVKSVLLSVEKWGYDYTFDCTVCI
jgi:Zn-dependent alcohol dehydrogenase